MAELSKKQKIISTVAGLALLGGVAGALIYGGKRQAPTPAPAYRTNTLALSGSLEEKKVLGYSTQEVAIDDITYRIVKFPETSTVKTSSGETLERKITSGVKLIPKTDCIEDIEGNRVEIKETGEVYFPVKVKIYGDVQSINTTDEPRKGRVKYLEGKLEEEVKPDQYGITVTTTVKEALGRLKKVTLKDTSNPRDQGKTYITIPFDTKIPESLKVIYIAEDAKTPARITRKGSETKLQLFLESIDLYVPVRGLEVPIPIPAPTPIPAPAPTPRATLTDPNPPASAPQSDPSAGNTTPTTQNRTAQHRVFTVKENQITDELSFLLEEKGTLELNTEFGPIIIEIEPECNPAN